MRQDYRRTCPAMLKDMMGARDALDNPAFTFKTAFNVAAVGKHVLRSPSTSLSRVVRGMRRSFPATPGIAKTEFSIFFDSDSTMVTLRGAILAHPHHGLHRLVDRAASNLRIGDMANCLDESHNRSGALKLLSAIILQDSAQILHENS
jgi:hypothetical protein